MRAEHDGSLLAGGLLGVTTRLGIGEEWLELANSLDRGRCVCLCKSNSNSVVGCDYKSNAMSSITNLELICTIVSYEIVVLYQYVAHLSLFQSV
jgi:hypothetical protein